MSSLSRREAREFLDIIERISDERVLYFYMMLGSALADALATRAPQQTPANTSMQHLQDIARRMTS